MDVSRLTDYAVKTCATANITTTMPRSFLIKKKNYSNCPLKKRPVHDLFIKDEKDGSGEDNSEPENLSTKPEDLSLHYPKALTPPTGVALKQAPTPTPAATATPAPPSSVIVQPTPASHFLAKSGPLEPLNLNTPTEFHHHPHHPHPATAAAGWHYPQPHAPHPYHLGFNYAYPPPTEFFHHHNHHLQQYSAAVRDQSRSPPPHVYSPVAVVASPKLFLPYAPSAPGLSPTSSSSSFHQPLSPEDLSSPGSVSSASSSSGGGSSGLGGGKKMRKDVTAARYQCPDCSKSYSTYSGLDKHRQHHCQASGVQAAKKSFSCKFCEKVYFSLGALKMHIRTHTLPCKCKLCGKAFSRPWLLQGHIRTHTGEKPFSCPHCSRAFADRSNLRAHLQTHSDVKKYSCSACGKTFSRMSLLSKHAESGCPASSTTSSPSPQPGAVVGASMPDDGRPLFH